MLNNLTNFFNLITGRMVKTKPADTDLIPLGTENPRYGGGYMPTGIQYKDLKADILAELPEEAGCGIQFGLNYSSVGSKVSFKKTDYAVDYRDVIIPGVLEITRKNNQGIYNAIEESGWNGGVSPVDTEWNSKRTDSVNYGWGNLGNVSIRTFDTFSNALNNIGCEVVGQELVMRHIPTGRMWIIIFTEWTQGGNGGGFAYDRYEIFAQTDFYRPPSSPLTVDVVSDGLIIKRDNIRGLYNAVLETKYDNNCDLSPLGTEWNSIYTDSVNFGFTNLADVRNRKFSTWRDAVDANPLAAFEDGLEMVMHDLSTDLYWKVLFTAWGSGEGNGYGEFGYERQLIPQDCGVKFNDGTVMTSASSNAACCPTIDKDGNTIVDDTSNNLVDVAILGTHLINNFSGMLIVNDHYDGRVETWIAGGGDTVLLGATNTGGVPPNSTLTMAASGYEWTNNDALTGPFTFTVIKTRNQA